MRYIYFILLIIAAFGCKKKDPSPNYTSTVIGTYKGYFYYADTSALIKADTNSYVIEIAPALSGTRVVIFGHYIINSSQLYATSHAVNQDGTPQNDDYVDIGAYTTINTHIASVSGNVVDVQYYWLAEVANNSVTVNYQIVSLINGQQCYFQGTKQ